MEANKGASNMQNTKTAFTDTNPAPDVPEAEWLAVAEVLLPAVDAGVVPEAAVAVTDAALDEIAEAVDDELGEEEEEAVELAEADIDPASAASFPECE